MPLVSFGSYDEEADVASILEQAHDHYCDQARDIIGEKDAEIARLETEVEEKTERIDDLVGALEDIRRTARDNI